MGNRAVWAAAIGVVLLLAVLGEPAAAAAVMASHPARITSHADAKPFRHVQFRRCAKWRSVRVGYRCLERFRGQCIRGEPIYETVCVRYE